MKIICWIICGIFSSSLLIAQSPFKGVFKGIYNGEAINLYINEVNGIDLMGTLTDAQASYSVKAEINGNRFAGEAIHQTLSLRPVILGELLIDKMNITLVFDVAGNKTEVKVPLNREKNQPVSSANSVQKIKLPSGAELNPDLVGVWQKEENYNSGSGSDFMGSTFTQSMIFFDDGSVGDGGSAATISGSDFLGQSKSSGLKKMEGVVWYTRSNQLYLQITQNGTSQEAHLGRYYIENRSMLITGTNGTKILLRKIQ
ncbi:MAG: hypothetical protein ABI844_01400 [Saprospiraceae bacterium]